MVDREARGRLVSAITRYMNEETTAFAFDEEIWGIRDATDDATVNHVACALWFHYDDCKDHLASLSQEEWDYFQRLVLLLESDAEMERVSRRRWSVRQLIAAGALACFGLCAATLDLGWHLIGFAILFGPVSILLGHWRGREREEEAPVVDLNLVPFASFTELRQIRRSVPGFSKRRYPAHAKTRGPRRVHGPLATATASMNVYLLWSLASPLVLLFQALPEKVTDTRIRQIAA